MGWEDRFSRLAGGGGGVVKEGKGRGDGREDYAL